MSREPRVIAWDIETSHNIVAAFGFHDDRVGHKDLLKEWYIICAAWKFLGRKHIYTTKVTDFDKFGPPDLSFKESYADEGVVHILHEVLSNVDGIVHHNGDKFDLKKFNARALFYGLQPIPPIVQIDTLKIARKHFKFSANRLDYLGQFLGLGNKIETSSHLWHQCLLGDSGAVEEMSRYNKRDVDLLEKVYEKLKPYEPAKLNYNLFKDTDNLCPSCGSGNVTHQGYRMARSGKMRRFKCEDCGAWHSKPVNGIAR